MSSSPCPYRFAVTVDIHRADEPATISAAAEFLRSRGIRATFFIPTALLDIPGFREAIHELGRQGFHAPASHGHEHDFEEIAALARGRGPQLRFLEASRKQFEDFFGRAPIAFRSPTWCGLGAAALDELVRLGYRVDSSATPQRPGLLSSFPNENPWMFTPRRPHFIRPGLLEVPTSTLGVPFGSPTFATLRRRGSLAMLHLLRAEARVFGSRVLTIQLHPSDVVLGAPQAGKSLSWRDFLPRTPGGIGLKEHIRVTDPERQVGIGRAIVAALAHEPQVMLDDLAPEPAPASA